MDWRGCMWTIVLALGLLTATAACDQGSPAAHSYTDRAMMLVVQLGAILLVAKLGNILFEKMKLPGVLGELVAGAIIGPYALGQVGFYGFPDGFLPSVGLLGVSPELFGLSSIAAVVLLFYVGLETNLKLLRRFLLAGGLVGLSGVVFSFALGMAVAWAMGPMLLERPVPFFSPTALFLGVVCSATSVGITARILCERHRLDAPEGVTILSAAVIDDVLGIVLLAVVMAIVGAGRSRDGIDWAHVAIVAGKALAIWVFAMAVGLVVSRRISSVLKWFGERTSIAIMALCLALILAGLFEEAGLAMIIGAYVMGLSLSQTDITHVIRDKLEPVYEFLVPIFFCVTGMMVDLSASLTAPVLLFGAGYTMAALLAKLMGCGFPALLANFNLRGAARIGMGMVPRGEVGLIIAGIGLSSGLIGPSLFAAAVMMIMANTILAPPALVALFRSDARGTRHDVRQHASEAEMRFSFPSMEMSEFFASKLAGVFEEDGFFTHLLSHDPPIYQLRKEEMLIDYRLSGTELLIDCRQSDVPLVNTAMYETAAAMERAARGLRRPFDSRDFGSRIQDTGVSGRDVLDVGRYLHPGLIEPKLRATTKAEVIDELLAILDREGKLRDFQAAQAAVWQREESMPTGLQYGLAIPHGKTDAVDTLVCTVGVKADGIDYGSMDGEPSRIFILTLSPPAKPVPHVRLMSLLSGLLDDRGRQMILDCRTAGEMYEVLTAKHSEAGDGPAARNFALSDYIRPDLLTPNLAGTTPEAVIDELLERMRSADKLSHVAAAKKALLEREGKMPTGVNGGLAIPHARTERVDELVCAVGLSPTGVDFGAPDRIPARIVILTLIPHHCLSPYLQLFASLSKQIGDHNRQHVLSATTETELYKALTGRAPRCQP